MKLTTLPTELIEHVASYLDLPTCCSFRLTCSSLSQQTIHTFKDRFFRKRILQWTRENLDMLVQITEHGTFGDALQQLIIDATPRHSIQLWQDRQYIASMPITTEDLDDPSLKSKLLSQYHHHSALAEETAKFFNETRYDQKCLKTTFTKLKTLHNITFTYEGMEATPHTLSLRYCLSSLREMSLPFVSTMSAIAASNLHITSITMHPLNHYGTIGIGRLETLAPHLRAFDVAFANLSTLHLHLRDWRAPEEGFALDTPRAPFVVRFVAKARNVRDFHLECYSSLERDILGEMAWHCTFDKLEKCTLGFLCICNADDLKTLFAPSSTTLKVLGLKSMLLADMDSVWSDLSQRLVKDIASLEELEMQNPASLDGSDTFRGSARTWKDECDWAGGVRWRYDRRGDARAWAGSATGFPFLGH